MTDPVDRVGPLRTVGRGLRRRCGRCGHRPVFEGYFRLAERCPGCGYRFNREEGFLTGVYLINFSVTLALMFVVLMAYVLWRAGTDASSTVVPVLVACVVLAVGTPVAFYPFAASTWAAMDLVMRPLEPDEEADAANWRAAR